MKPRQLLPALLLLLATGVFPLRAASVSSLLEQLERTPALDQTAETPGAALQRALAGEPYGSDCLTPLLLAAERRPATATLRRLLQLPRLPAERVFTAASGLFRIHYTLRPDSPHALPGTAEDVSADVPRHLERVEQALADAYRLIVDDLGFHAPGDLPFIEVYLADLGPALSGAVVPALGNGSRHQEQRDGALILSNRLTDPGPVAAHQLAHLVLLSYSSSEPLWWHEATATWMGVLAAGDATGEASHVRALLAAPEQGLATEDVGRMRGALLLPAFLALGEPSAVRRVWEECGALAGDNLLEAIDLVAEADGRGSLQDLLRAFFASWVAESAGRTRLSASLGIELPMPSLSAEVSTYPAAGMLSGGPVRPLGASFLHFVSLPGEPGGLSLSVLGTPETAWDVLLLVRSGADDLFAAVPMEMSEDGQGEVRFPWSTVSDSLVVVVNMDHDAEPGRVSYWARHQATIPFDLLDFHAFPMPDGVGVQWTTDSESDLFGWNLYRSARPFRGFARLNGVLIPAAGSRRDPATYTFVDSSAVGRKVYYYLEALTLDGFRETTYIIGTYPPQQR